MLPRQLVHRQRGSPRSRLPVLRRTPARRPRDPRGPSGIPGAARGRRLPRSGRGRHPPPLAPIDLQVGQGLLCATTSATLTPQRRPMTHSAYEVWLHMTPLRVCALFTKEMPFSREASMWPQRLSPRRRRAIAPDRAWRSSLAPRLKTRLARPSGCPAPGAIVSA